MKLEPLSCTGEEKMEVVHVLVQFFWRCVCVLHWSFNSLCKLETFETRIAAPLHLSEHMVGHTVGVRSLSHDPQPPTQSQFLCIWK